MNRQLTISLLALCLIACGGNRDKNVEAGTDVTVQARSAPIPSSASCGDAASAERIRKAMSLIELEGMTEEEARTWDTDEDNTGLTSNATDTIYDTHCLLCIRRTAGYMGAYPSTSMTYHNFDKRTGNRITASQLFSPSGMDKLISLCENRINAIAAEDRKTLIAGNAGQEETEIYDQQIAERPKFTKNDLDNFYLKKDSIVFAYNFDFPHVIQNMQPVGDIGFSKSDIVTYLQEGGLLAEWIK